MTFPLGNYLNFITRKKEQKEDSHYTLNSLLWKGNFHKKT